MEFSIVIGCTEDNYDYARICAVQALVKSTGVKYEVVLGAYRCDYDVMKKNVVLSTKDTSIKQYLFDSQDESDIIRGCIEKCVYRKCVVLMLGEFSDENMGELELCIGSCVDGRSELYVPGNRGFLLAHSYDLCQVVGVCGGFDMGEVLGVFDLIGTKLMVLDCGVLRCAKLEEVAGSPKAYRRIMAKRKSKARAYAGVSCMYKGISV